MARQHLGGGRPLQRQQRAVVGRHQPHAGRQPRVDLVEIGGLGGGIDHQHQHAVLPRLVGAGHHQVVEDAARVVEELGVALLARLQPDDVGRHQRLQRPRRGLVVGAEQERLAHVRDVEQAGLGAGVGVLGQDAGEVLHRHLVAGKGDESGAACGVARVQRRLPERLLGLDGGRGVGRLIGHGRDLDRTTDADGTSGRQRFQRLRAQSDLTASDRML